MSLLYKEIADKIITSIQTTNNPSNRLLTEREYSILYNVSRQTVRKALEECEKLGIITKRQGSGIYLSDSFMKSMNHCALLLPDEEDYIYPSFKYELEKRLSLINYSLTVYNHHNRILDEKNCLERIINNPVSVLVVIVDKNNYPTPLSEYYKQIASSGCRILFINNPYPNLNDYSYIKYDDFYSGYSVAKRINNTILNWCCIYVDGMRSSMDRYYGFVQCMIDNKYSFNEKNIHWIQYEQLMNIRSNDITSIKNIINTYSTTPSVIVGGNDEIIFACLNYLHNIRVVTDDIEFITFDNSYPLSTTDVKIHSYDGDKGMLFSKIIEFILSKEKKEKEVITLPSNLKI